MVYKQRGRTISSTYASRSFSIRTGLLALAANLSSVLLLMPYKDGEANVRWVWLCSSNDAIGNAIVMVAALGVWVRDFQTGL